MKIMYDNVCERDGFKNCYLWLLLNIKFQAYIKISLHKHVSQTLDVNSYNLKLDKILVTEFDCVKRKHQIKRFIYRRGNRR